MNLDFYVENIISTDLFINKLKIYFEKFKIEYLVFKDIYDSSQEEYDIVYQIDRYKTKQMFSTTIAIFIHNDKIASAFNKFDFFTNLALLLNADILVSTNISPYDYLIFNKGICYYLVEEDGTNEDYGFILYPKMEITKDKAFDILYLPLSVPS